MESRLKNLPNEYIYAEQNPNKTRDISFQSWPSGATSLQGILFSRKHIIRNLTTRNFFYKEFPSQESHNKEFFLQGISFTRNLTTRNFTVRNFFYKEFFLQGISQQGKFFARNFFTKNFETRKFFTRNCETRNLKLKHFPKIPIVHV